MQILVRLFALQREQTGWRRRALEVPDGATIIDAWALLVTEYPALASATGVVRFARNAQYAHEGDRLAPGDELAIIPPVAGGAPDAPGPDDALRPDREGRPDDVPGPDREGASRRIELRAEAIDDALIADLRRTVPSDSDGAVVFFVGQTRETAGTPAPGQESHAERFRHQRVEELAYEAFDEMALQVMHAIADEIAQRWRVRRLAIVHRTGTVPVGEVSVVICAAAAHRAEAFEACRYAIEELKARAPIWKSEHFADGSVWIGTPARERAANQGERRSGQEEEGR